MVRAGAKVLSILLRASPPTSSLRYRYLLLATIAPDYAGRLVRKSTWAMSSAI
jgi:hypothetical protein